MRYSHAAASRKCIQGTIGKVERSGVKSARAWVSDEVMIRFAHRMPSSIVPMSFGDIDRQPIRARRSPPVPSGFWPP